MIRASIGADHGLGATSTHRSPTSHPHHRRGAEGGGLTTSRAPTTLSAA